MAKRCKDWEHDCLPPWWSDRVGDKSSIMDGEGQSENGTVFSLICTPPFLPFFNLLTKILNLRSDEIELAWNEIFEANKSRHDDTPSNTVLGPS